MNRTPPNPGKYPVESHSLTFDTMDDVDDEPHTSGTKMGTQLLSREEFWKEQNRAKGYMNRYEKVFGERIRHQPITDQKFKNQTLEQCIKKFAVLLHNYKQRYELHKGQSEDDDLVSLTTIDLFDGYLKNMIVATKGVAPEEVIFSENSQLKEDKIIQQTDQFVTEVEKSLKSVKIDEKLKESSSSLNSSARRRKAIALQQAQKRLVAQKKNRELAKSALLAEQKLAILQLESQAQIAENKEEAELECLQIECDDGDSQQLGSDEGKLNNIEFSKNSHKMLTQSNVVLPENDGKYTAEWVTSAQQTNCVAQTIIPVTSQLLQKPPISQIYRTSMANNSPYLHQTNVTPHYTSNLQGPIMTAVPSQNYGPQSVLFPPNISQPPLLNTVQQSGTALNPQANTYVPLQSLQQQGGRNSFEIQRTLDSKRVQSDVIGKFSGEDPQDFILFRIRFEEEFGMTHNLTDTQRYEQLRKYTEKEAHIEIQPEKNNRINAYEMAMKALEKKYGRANIIVQSVITKLQEWPIMEKQDPPALKVLLYYLRQLRVDMVTIPELASPFSSEYTLRNIVSRLPRFLHSRYQRELSKEQERLRGAPIQFQFIVDFIERIYTEWNQPKIDSFSKTKENSSQLNSKQQKRTFSSQAECNARATSTSHQSNNRNQSLWLNDGNQSSRSYDRKPVQNSNSNFTYKCYICDSSDHKVTNCPTFIALSVEERWKQVTSENRCHNCLRLYHSKNNCRNARRCTHCGRDHHSLLHHEKNDLKRTQAHSTQKLDDKPCTKNTKISQSKTQSQVTVTKPIEQKESEETSSNLVQVKSSSTKINSKKTICPCLPILIHASNGAKIHTYMGMDTFSSDNWMNDKLLKEIGMKTEDVSLSLTTLSNQNETLISSMINDVVISNLNGKDKYTISRLYSQKKWPFKTEDIFSKKDQDKFKHLKKVPIQYLEDTNIGILIGSCESELLHTFKAVRGPKGKNLPFAAKYRLGWAVSGSFPDEVSKTSQTNVCHRISVTQVQVLSEQIREYFTQDFKDSHDITLGPSINDKKWTKKVQESVRQLPDKHYCIDLPVHDDLSDLGDNKFQILKQFESMYKRLEKDKNYKNEYSSFVDMMVKQQFVERVPLNELVPDHPIWYISHHGVVHKVKKKLRVVFNCSLKYKGVSLNDRLYQGPDLTNNLIGILIRFRKFPFAFSGDIEKMFYQVKVPTRHADLLRFLWKDPTTNEIIIYRLTVHVFGAVSSPSVANYALRKVALDNPDYDEVTRKAVDRNFYVDDVLMSLFSLEEAIKIRKNLKNLLLEGGFNLVGFSSNKKEILNTIPKEELASNCIDDSENHCKELLPIQQALGIRWDTEEDCLGYRCVPKLDTVDILTRRILLSEMLKIYDPLGFAQPTILLAKKIFQRACGNEFEWDTELPKELKDEWKIWKLNSQFLLKYKFQRSIVPDKKIFSQQIHIFSDGSDDAYGSIAYMRTIMEDRTIVVSPLLAKARLVPKDKVTLKTTPRIELNGAKLSVIISQILHKELDINNLLPDVYWTDSRTVLQYLSNTSRKFQVFVTRRVEFILQSSKLFQWHHVPGLDNPADIISRGMKAKLLCECSLWKNGPKFLCGPEENYPSLPTKEGNEEYLTINDSNQELKLETAALVISVHKIVNDTYERLLKYSSWQKLYRIVGYMLRFVHTLKIKCKNRPKEKCSSDYLSLLERNTAKMVIYKLIQKEYYPELYNILIVNKDCKNANECKNLPKDLNVLRLAPFMKSNETCIRVGGRIRRSFAVSEEVKHPILLPNECPIVKTICVDIHNVYGHIGRTHCLSILRQEYWVIRCTRLIRNILYNCTKCRKELATPITPFMSDLPEERLRSDLKPFTHVGLDCFGPFIVSNFRREKKVWGLLITCMSTRAIHLEAMDSMNTDTFLLALKRFIARRGFVKSIRSDKGTNFVGANRELQEAMTNWNQGIIREYLHPKNIEWHFHPGQAPHFGGLWEREVRSVKRILHMFNRDDLTRHNFESFRTLLCEVESILNSRPLTALSNDPHDMQAITPNHIIHGYPPSNPDPTVLVDTDAESLKRYKLVQNHASGFWRRWRTEYLPLLQERSKWRSTTKPININQLVLLSDTTLPRNCWKLGRIMKLLPSKDGIVRKVLIRVSRGRSSDTVIELERAVATIVPITDGN